MAWGGMGEDGGVPLIWDLPTERKMEVKQGVGDRRSRKEGKRRERKRRGEERKGGEEEKGRCMGLKG